MKLKRFTICPKFFCNGQSRFVLFRYIADLTVTKHTNSILMFYKTGSPCYSLMYIFGYLFICRIYTLHVRRNLGNHHVRLSANIHICMWHFCARSISFKTEATMVAEDPCNGISCPWSEVIWPMSMLHHNQHGISSS